MPEAVSVVDGGRHDGTALNQLVAERGAELLGSSRPWPTGGFPLLIKLLDAHRMLSVQVHPDAEQARRAGVRPKTEAWFVLHAEPDARLLIGMRSGVGQDDVRRALAAGGGELPELLASRPARAGETHLIEAGTVHCLGAGVLLAEVQQPSDTTYRLYDWGRGRELHVDAALASIAWDRPAPGPSTDGQIDCEAFSARWQRGGGRESAQPRCRVVIATSTGTLAGASVAPGDVWLLPASCPDVSIETADYIRVTAP